MKQTEIGLIPDDWEVKKLEELFTFRYGDGNTNPSNNGEYPVYGANGIIGGYTKYNAEDSIIIGHMGEYAGSVIWAEGKHFVTYNGTITKSRNENLINSKYGFYALYNRNINAICAGSGYPFLAYDKLNSIKIPLPPIEEQQRIAKALSDVDALITTTEKLIQKKKNIKQGTMQNLLTGKKRLPGFAKSTEYKQTELGLIPEDWEVRELGNCCLINPQSSSLIPDKFIYIDLESVNSGKLEKKQIFDKKNAPSRAQRIFKMDDILYQTVRPYQKNNLYVNFDSSNYIASTGYAIVRADCKVAISKYIYHILHTNNFVNTVLDNCTGTSYPAINPNFLKTILIPLPSKKEQNAIANVLSCMDKEIETLNTKLEKYRNLKTAMMQQLLTGKIRLVK